MAVFVQRTLICNKCKNTYTDFSGERKLAVLYQNCYFSICEDCTKEVAALMGYTPETLNKELSKIKEVESQEKLEREMCWGDRCRKCEKKFDKSEFSVRVPYEGEPESKFGPVREYDYFHKECYE